MAKASYKILFSHYSLDGTNLHSHALSDNAQNYKVPATLMRISRALFECMKQEDSPTKIQKKREDYLEWRDYFMAVAVLAAKRSKDPNCQVGACIVNKEMKIIGVGYNGMPAGCSDDEFPWGKEGSSPLDEKSLYVCHAEMNAIINKNSADVKDCCIYVTLFPCNECAKFIIQSGVTEVVYLSDKYSSKPKYMASKRMFIAAGIKCRQFIPKRDKIEIKFTTHNNNINDICNLTI